MGGVMEKAQEGMSQMQGMVEGGKNDMLGNLQGMKDKGTQVAQGGADLYQEAGENMTNPIKKRLRRSGAY